jgi:hypothetical protein
VPEDRFGDLGPPAPDGRSAAERFAELDEREPEPDAPERRRPPESARPSGRYMWVVGVAAIVLLVVVGVHGLRSGSGAFLKGPDPLEQLPEFAAPLVDGPKDKDANLVPRSTKSKQTPACDVRVPGSLNICDQWSKPVVLSFLFVRGAKCEPHFDALERMRREFGDRVNFVGVFFERDHDRVEQVVRRHSWQFPIVVDRDGAVTNLYSVGGCPTTVFAYRGGRVRGTLTGTLGDDRMRATIGRLLR